MEFNCFMINKLKATAKAVAYFYQCKIIDFA